jgi:hypothetical protein
MMAMTLAKIGRSMKNLDTLASSCQLPAGSLSKSQIRSSKSETISKFEIRKSETKIGIEVV